MSDPHSDSVKLSLQLGDTRVFVIRDAMTAVDAGGAFGLIPRSLWSRYFQADDQNRVPMAMHCLLIQTGGHNILIDTGLGDISATQASFWSTTCFDRLVPGLQHIGLGPADIDIVVNTHLHADHCGGNTRRDTEGRMRPAFADARYIVQRTEYEHASQPDERTRGTYLADNFQPLRESGQLELIDGDTDIVAGVRVVVTPGHTRGHMSVIIGHDETQVLFLCDMATFMVHFERLNWMTAYDEEPLVTLETKRIWQRWALDTGAMLLSVHDPHRPCGRLVQTVTASGRTVLQVEPIDIPIVAV